jgi:hypothetical protein
MWVVRERTMRPRGTRRLKDFEVKRPLAFFRFSGVTCGRARVGGAAFSSGPTSNVPLYLSSQGGADSSIGAWQKVADSGRIRCERRFLVVIFSNRAEVRGVKACTVSGDHCDSHWRPRRVLLFSPGHSDAPADFEHEQPQRCDSGSHGLHRPGRRSSLSQGSVMPRLASRSDSLS